MEADSTYRVQFSGKFLAGVAPADATAAFAALAKISPQQAAVALSEPRVLKKQLDLKVANTYRDKLLSIGLDVVLQPETPPKPVLSLEPIVDRHGKAAQPESQPAPAVAGLATTASGLVVCPKCGHQQKNPDKCESCGVYIHKLLSRQEAGAAKQSAESRTPVAAEAESTDADTRDQPQDPRPLAILAVFGVALVCAYVWKLIAVWTEYEVGIVAWAIGGAIGFTAIAMGSIGIRTGIICGVLALCSIIGGKYLVVDAFFDQLTGEMQSTLAAASAEESWQQDIGHAQQFAAEVDTDEEMRQFMVEHGYTEEESAGDISAEELQTFKDEIAPYLRNFAENPITPETLGSMDGSEFFEQYTGLNTWDGLWVMLSPIDFLFFFLGVGTAFRMGATGRVK